MEPSPHQRRVCTHVPARPGRRSLALLSAAALRIVTGAAICFAGLQSFTPFAAAETAKGTAQSTVYRWVDEEGRVHFSTDPAAAARGKPADLPRLQKENLDSRIESIRSSTPRSCEQHGGEDCTRGADQDGSVICLDGYRDAVLPFRFHCMEARLQTDLLVLVADSSDFIKHGGSNLARRLEGKTPMGLQLNVRNLSGVKALDVHVELLLPGSGPRQIPGPPDIDAHGSADFMLPFTELRARPTVDQIAKVRYRVRCTNCESVGKLIR